MCSFCSKKKKMYILSNNGILEAYMKDITVEYLKYLK